MERQRCVEEVAGSEAAIAAGAKDTVLKATNMRSLANTKDHPSAVV